MRIEDIIYNTTRGIYSIEDKLSIATVFIFCYRFDTVMFSRLLYEDNPIGIVDYLNEKFKSYNVDFSVRFENKQIFKAFKDTATQAIMSYDANGFHKAVFEKDQYAIKIVEIAKIDFKKINMRAKLKKEVEQLRLLL